MLNYQHTPLEKDGSGIFCVFHWFLRAKKIQGRTECRRKTWFCTNNLINPITYPRYSTVNSWQTCLATTTFFRAKNPNLEPIEIDQRASSTHSTTFFTLALASSTKHERTDVGWVVLKIEIVVEQANKQGKLKQLAHSISRGKTRLQQAEEKTYHLLTIRIAIHVCFLIHCLSVGADVSGSVNGTGHDRFRTDSPRRSIENGRVQFNQ